MGEDIVISVRDLSKVYKIYQRPLDTLFEVISGRKLHQDFWALQDISFDVAEGEILGIIGRNGAGKSTLLKILSGTLDKTAGEVSIAGKISAILELGTGFHPEYSGRENIYLGGLCLGMSREEIDKKIDDIIDFSELAQFIEQPLKTYSTGMQGRLAFSVAMSVDPDVLIIDEALATGDILFQEKCFRRIQEICRKGKAVLLVTHSLHHIYEVCTKCILLHNSMVVEYGEPRKVGERYERLLAEQRHAGSPLGQGIIEEKTIGLQATSTDKEYQCNTKKLTTDSYPIKNKEASRAKILSMNALNMNYVDVTTLIYGRKYRIVMTIIFFDSVPSVNVGFQLQKETGLVVIGDTTYENKYYISGKPGKTVTVVFEFICRLAMGTYLLRGGITEIHPDGSYSICHLMRSHQLLSVEGKRLNGLVDPLCSISVMEKG